MPYFILAQNRDAGMLGCTKDQQESEDLWKKHLSLSQQLQVTLTFNKEKQNFQSLFLQSALDIS